MKHPLLKYLCCPKCKRSLKATPKALLCLRCKLQYKIINGIAVLIDLSSLPAHLQNQVQYFEKEDLARKSYVLETWQKRYVDNYLAHYKWRRNSLVIDNATGSGYMAIELAKRGISVIALDLTFTELLKLKGAMKKLKLQSNILLVCASSEDLPIKSDVADGMVANAILEHLPHERHAIKEIERVLSNNALLMLAMPIKMQYVWPFLWPVNMLHDRRIGHLRRYTRGSILKGFSRFMEIKTYYTGSIGKVACIALQIMTKDKRFEVLGERLDQLVSQMPYGASNVVTILQKI